MEWKLRMEAQSPAWPHESGNSEPLRKNASVVEVVQAAVQGAVAVRGTVTAGVRV